VANSIVVHVGAVRTGTTAPSAFSWTGVSLDAGYITSRAGSTNMSVHVAHETKAVAGVTTARALNWTTNGQADTVQLILEPSSGAAPKGLEVIVRATTP
jgi:hypothetical protein